MGCSTMPRRLHTRGWIIVLTGTKPTDARQHRVFFKEHLPEHALFHSCIKGNNSGHSRTGSGKVANAMHKSLTSQYFTELIDHNDRAAKPHLITLRMRPLGSDCLTMWGVYLLNDDLQKTEELYGDPGCCEL